MNRLLLLVIIVGNLAAQVAGPLWLNHLSAMTRLRAAGRLEEAQLEGAAAEALLEKAPQPDIRLALVYNSLASLEQDTGNWHRAEIHYKQSTRILGQLPRKDNLEGLAAVANNFGTLYTKMNRPDRAEPLLREAILLRTEVLGAEHPETIRSRMNLAQLFQVMNRLEEAEQSFRELLLFWTAHPEFKIEHMITANNLAVIALRLGRLDEASSGLEEVLADFNSFSDSYQLFKARVQISLGNCNRLRGKLPRAEELLKQALESLTGLVGVEHPDYARALLESAQVMRKTGRKALAAKQEKQARAIVARHAEANFLGHTVDARTLSAAK